MIEPRPIPTELVADALAEAGRLLSIGDYHAAEQACIDVLAAKPDSVEALCLLVDAKTLLFRHDPSSSTAPLLKLITVLRDEFSRQYLTGLVYERWATAQTARGAPPYAATQWLREAMNAYDKADKICAGKDVRPRLRWNVCLRIQQPDRN